MIEKTPAKISGGMIGVVHLPALPGDPHSEPRSGFAPVERRVLADGAALVQGGVDALLVENFGSMPFVKGTEGHRLLPHQVAIMALVARTLKIELDCPVGINCLRSDGLSAIGIAAAARADFVRINVHVGAYVTDQGLIEGEAHQTVPYRQQLGADHVAILADVLVKHAVPLAPLNATDATRDTFDRGLADGVIVTGRATGQPIDRPLLEEIRTAAGGRTLFLGSGVTPHNVADLAPLADGAIVGTWVKSGGDVFAPVDPDRVRRMADLLHGALRSPHREPSPTDRSNA